MYKTSIVYKSKPSLLLTLSSNVSNNIEKVHVVTIGIRNVLQINNSKSLLISCDNNSNEFMVLLTINS